MAEHSPLPWRVDGIFIFDSDGGAIAAMCEPLYKDDAALIVEAVNNFAPFIQDRRRLIGELDSVKAQLDWHKRQLKAVKSDAESQERWANQYFEQAQKAEAERDRLRDIMRGLVAILETITLEDHEIELLDEAREAIGEGEQ